MIEFRSVGKRFPDGTVAVEDFSFVLPSRKTTVFVGSSGCGKTTLLRMINRMVEPTTGQVLIDDVDVATQDRVKLRRSIGYVLQSSGLLPHRTCRRQRRHRAGPQRRAEGAGREPRRSSCSTRWASTAALADRYPRQLSGGQQQRVGVARALAATPTSC